MYRACMAVYGQAPHQLEMMLIRELMKEPQNCAGSEIEAEFEEGELTIAMIEERLNAVEVYSDDGIRGP